MSDTKQLSFELKVLGVSAEQGELAKLNLALQDLNKARKDLNQSYKDGKVSQAEYIAQMASINRSTSDTKDQISQLKKVVDSAPDSLNRMRQSLIDLKDQYANGSAALRTQLTPEIQKLTTEISKSEQAIGVHQRNVGNYPQLFSK